LDGIEKLKKSIQYVEDKTLSGQFLKIRMLEELGGKLEQVVGLAIKGFKLAITSWGAKNNIDFISLSYTHHAEDVRNTHMFFFQSGRSSSNTIFHKNRECRGFEAF